MLRIALLKSRLRNRLYAFLIGASANGRNIVSLSCHPHRGQLNVLGRIDSEVWCP